MSIIQGSAKQGSTRGFYPKLINGSLRLNDDDSAYLTWTPASAGNRKTWTYSFWVKRGNLGTNQYFLDQTTGGSDSTYAHLHWYGSTDKIRLSGWTVAVTTDAVFRDPSAWYHVVFVVDTTEATDSDRVKIYVNGVQQSTSGTYYGLNDDTPINATSLHRIGGNGNLDGYLANVHFIDGQALTASDFGELKSGIWIPKSPSVTYGTNGFKLTFEDSAAIGDDTSGNGNDWTVNNLVASDVVPDSPTNNFCTLNPIDAILASLTAQGNLAHSTYSTSWRQIRSTIQIPTTGKWYAEYYVRTSDDGGYDRVTCGLADATFPMSTSASIGSSANSVGYFADGGTITRNGTLQQTVSTATVGDVIGMAYDADSNSLQFYKNGVAIGTAVTPIASDTYFFASSIYNNANSSINFGQDSTFAGAKTAGGNTDANGIGDFQYAPPSGFLALCTSNLPDPVIDPAQDATPEDHFNVALWTGNGSTQSIDVGHASDFVWIKTRNVAVDHRNYDSVRGVNTALRSNTTNAEAVETTSLTSFDSTGFSLGNYAGVNNSGSTYVGWSWKAGGTGVSNTDGSITSTVSANTTSGFSIVGYTGAGGTATVGHGLSSAPEMVIVKRREVSGEQWVVWVAPIHLTNTDGYLELNTTAADGNNGNIFTTTAPTASVFSIGNSPETNSSGLDYISYCFHSVDGFSKVGSYVGNGSTDGPFVYTGFRPAFVITKRTDSTSNWAMHDAARDSYNVVDGYLYPNLSNSEDTASAIDFLSNGFKQRNTYASSNSSGGTYIYMAFAEMPTKFSLAR